ncbi:unnamed protein product [Albugo candida]|uniref:Cyclic nucleotide-binding domain-containing protein n=1 Tax=Albugo candida TaxID=65357 RepID=A0A024GL68_9STRA|nr:unnamed protein product [Albugo candida]|eukprot:CCI47086.1 unnamed protein product [Albugo candida]
MQQPSLVDLAQDAPVFRDSNIGFKERDCSEQQPSRPSFRDLLQSRTLKDMVNQAMVVKRWKEHGMNQDQQALDVISDARVHSENVNSMKPGLIRFESQLHSKMPSIEESCRQALEKAPSLRTPLEVQGIQAWMLTSGFKETKELQSFSQEELEKLCSFVTLAQYPIHHTLYRQGDAIDAFYFVFSGIVQLQVKQTTASGAVTVIVGESSKYEILGECGIATEASRNETAIVKTLCELVKVPRDAYLELIASQKDFSLKEASMTQKKQDVDLLGPSYYHILNILAIPRDLRDKSSVNTLTSYLQTLRFFRPLLTSFVRELCDIVDVLRVDSGCTVFAEGDTGDLFYVILNGSVDILVNAKDMRGQVQQNKLVNLTEGSHFGELALITGNGIRSATVITRENCVFLTISEKDYNATLRRMQNEEWRGRVDVLQRIPRLQTEAWTPELLREISYVSLDKRLRVGTVLFRQDELAQHIYFIVRGEMTIEKEITDPFTLEKRVMTVARLRKYHIIGEDAATGTHFNMPTYRQFTATASTPVQIFVLSKYDVYHRLSRVVRESLQALSHETRDEIMYVDRLYKTDKWRAYKENTLAKHGASKAYPSVHRHTTGTELVDCNDFLLVPHDRDGTRLNGSFVRDHVTRCNPEAASSPRRQRELECAIRKDEKQQLEVLNEGNPMTYLPHSFKKIPTLLMNENFVFSQPLTLASVSVADRKRHAKEDSVRTAGEVEQVKPASPTDIPRTGVTIKDSTDLALYLRDLETGAGFYLTSLDRIAYHHETKAYKIGRNKMVLISNDSQLREQQQFLYNQLSRVIRHEDVSAEEIRTRQNVLCKQTSTASQTNSHLGALEPLHPRPNEDVSLENATDESIVPLVVVATVIVSSQDAQTATGTTRWLCIHPNLSSELETIQSAYLSRYRRYADALICVLPINRWIRWDEMYRYCVQMESKFARKTSLRCRKKTLMSRMIPTENHSSLEPHAIRQVHKPPHPTESADLHSLICRQLGVDVTQVSSRSEISTARPHVSLGQKIDALQEYLKSNRPQTTSRVTLRSLQQMKKFGAILKTRIARVAPVEEKNALY